MHYAAIDLHENASQMCIYDEETDRYVERRVRTGFEEFRRALEKHSGARVLLEASTESEWVAQWLEELGFEVIVADPNFAPMYARRTRPRCGLRIAAVALARKLAGILFAMWRGGTTFGLLATA